MLLLAICAILGWLGSTYSNRRRALEAQSPARPDLLPAGVSGASKDWYFRKTDEKGRTLVEIWAKNFKQEKNASDVQLEGVRLHLIKNGGDKFDLVESPSATFQPSQDKLYADGEVSITLDVPAQDPPAHRLVSIRTSGVTFNNKTALTSTDRPADFTFENGTGRCVGATYDPNTKELQMRASVELNLKARGEKGQPMKLEAGQLVYNEQGSSIVLSPWARLTRETSTLEGGQTFVTLNDGVVELVDAVNAKGIENTGDRATEYSAGRLMVHYTPDGDVDRVTGEPDARLVSSAEAARTTTTSDKIDLFFESKDHQTILTSAFATGHAVLESKPLAAPPGRPMPDTRILRSDMIEMKMREGGREISEVRTPSAGHVEFLPNHPGARRRQMDGDRIEISYAHRNVIQWFHTVNARTRTDPASKAGAPLETSSKDMLAEFDTQTGQMQRIRQSGDFRYQEGDRRAVASQATLEQNTNTVILETGARVWDPAGTTSADLIRLDQSNGNFTAEGHVSSSRVQDKKAPESGLLSGSEPVQATAQRMTSTNRNSLIRYEGQADMWQGASRIRADRIEIDREARRLVASGSVQTQLLEQQKEATPARPGAPSVFTIVKAAGLVYTDADRQAYYTGGALLTRPDLRVKSIELRSYLSEAGSDNSLDRAYADGKVEIRQTAPGRTRTGTSEHAEYYTADQKILLRGGAPQLVDSVKGGTQGSDVTYYAGDDRVLVNGAPEQPAKSRIRRK